MKIRNIKREKTAPVPVSHSEGEELEASRLEEELSVFIGQFTYARDSVTEVSDNINGSCEKIIELSDLGGLIFHESGFCL